MSDCAVARVAIGIEVCDRLGLDRKRVYYADDRTIRIFQHYQRTWDRSRRKSHLYLDQLVQRCISDLARGNGLDNQRTEVRL